MVSWIVHPLRTWRKHKRIRQELEKIRQQGSVGAQSAPGFDVWNDEVAPRRIRA